MRFIAGLFAGLAILGVATMAVLTPGFAGGSDTDLRAALAALARQRVLFGHQSVGGNIVEGLAGVSSGAGAGLAIRDVTGSPAPDGPVFAHALIPENGDPALKLTSFAALMERVPGVDVALMKFCYVDFDATTDVDALFARYRAAHDALAARYPRTTFVHVTTPLTTVQAGPKAWIKNLIGRPLGGVAENAARERYNRLLREAYGGREPLFDLARVESTRPDGTIESAQDGGVSVPALVPAYSSDGGHLNAEGEARLARALVQTLASVAAARAKPAAGETSASSQ